MMTLHDLRSSLACGPFCSGPCARYSRGVTRIRRDRSGEAPPADARDADDPSRLADEARAQREKMAAELRSTPLPIATEPATTYRA